MRIKKDQRLLALGIPIKNRFPFVYEYISHRNRKNDLHKENISHHESKEISIGNLFQAPTQMLLEKEVDGF